ncbi:transcriptional regulator repressor [Fulvimarina pelagi HTCC2506]|uniref:Transcriptional regulator repressor n=1 Tax=Fulvimarina pelagi HTCC2506 TaxID=314231 RepID=Q0G3Z3_9HYPH|nr:LacI family DNA-binding transcriptional regulator [Fulvimarina pelagi]EAU41688.1 transcriptional regulator repressor [Fulvimarina pelagi HTCC2506]
MALKDIARELGLSQTTVSRALNGYPEVGVETRRRVFAAAEKLNYRPNAVARRLATGRAGAFGVVSPRSRRTLASPIVTDFLTGVSDKLTEDGLNLVFSQVEEGREREGCDSLIASGTVDGLILFSPLLEDERTAGLATLNFPIVAHGRPLTGTPVPSISIDNHNAFCVAAGYLLARGHRRIGLLNGDEHQAYAMDRLAGVEAALRDVEDARLVLASPGDMSFERGRKVTLNAIDQHRSVGEAGRTALPTALLCSSILLALGAIAALRERGLEVPRDVSIIAHDDQVAALPPIMTTPALTTTSSSIRAAGRRVAELLQGRIRGDVPTDYAEVWKADLVERGSVRHLD